jgi:hypothetical protein
MRKLIGGMAAVAVLMSLPVLAQAQRRAASSMGGAKHEFGVDLGIAYVKPDQADGGIVIGTPVDVRVGLVTPKKMMWEPRFRLSFASSSGNTLYLFSPGVNLLFANSPGGHRNGMYFTAGGGLTLGDLGGGSGTAFTANGGVGWRKPYGNAAWRYELGVTYDSESAELLQASTISIGARVGISLWH